MYRVLLYNDGKLYAAHEFGHPAQAEHDYEDMVKSLAFFPSITVKLVELRDRDDVIFSSVPKKVYRIHSYDNNHLQGAFEFDDYDEAYKEFEKMKQSIGHLPDIRVELVGVVPEKVLK
jgi:hypothetical protein